MDFEIPIQAKLENNILVIEGQAIDTTVNDRNWAIEEADIPEFMASLQDSVVQIRDTHHSGTTKDIKGKVVECWREDYVNPDGLKVAAVRYKAHVLGDPELLQKILEGCITDSSPGCIAADYVCSVCRQPDRDETRTKIVHMCTGGHEVLVKPRWIEQSLVPRGAYAKNKIRPIGFKAGQNLSLLAAIKANPGLCTNIAASLESQITGTAQPNPVDRLNGQDEQNMSDEENIQIAQSSLDVKALAKSISEELNIDGKISEAIKPIQEKLQAMQTPKPKPTHNGTGRVAEVETVGPFGSPVPDYLAELQCAVSTKKAAVVAGAPIVDEEEAE